MRACPDCAVDPGSPHEDGCDVAPCTECGFQRISCDHDDQDVGWGSIWTGTWPGNEDARRLDLWTLFTPGTGFAPCSADTPGAVPDLNRLILGQWNAVDQRWESRT